MSTRAKTLCIACGREVANPPVLNSLPDGRPCAVCRERVFESLPPLLPARPAARKPAVDEDAERALYQGLDAAAFLDDPRFDPPA